MKKILALFLAILTVISLTACSQESKLKNELGVEVEINMEGTNFEEEEIIEAIKLTKENFNFNGCKLLKLSYNENKVQYTVERYVTSNVNKIDKIAKHNILIITADFVAEEPNEIFEQGQVITDYTFVYIRKNKNLDWEFAVSGY